MSARSTRQASEPGGGRPPEFASLSVLAETLGISRSRIEIIAGEGSRT